MIIKAFKKSYDNFTLNCPELNLLKGKIYVVIGANGSGKSTLAKCISDVINNDNNDNNKLNVGYLNQISYPFRMSLLNNIMLNTSDETYANKIIDKLDLSELKNKNGKDLSVGQTSRMALARILVRKYDLLILDEPTASMDMKSSLLSEQVIKEYLNDDTTILLITHSIAQAKRLGDYYLYLDNGELLDINDIKELDNPKNESLKTFLNF